MNDKTALAPDEIHQIAFEEGQPADNGDGVNECKKCPVPPAGGDVIGDLISVMRNAVRDDANNGGRECFEKARSAEGELRAHVTRLQADVITLEQKINLLRYHLSDYEFEWEKAQVQRLAGWYCPECGRNKEAGHSDKCELAQALKPLKTDEDFQQFREYIAEDK